MPVETQACGTPVIAYGKGGALETVIAGQTGIFFEEQTPQSLIKAVEKFEQMPAFNPQTLRKMRSDLAKRASKPNFKIL